MIKATALYWLGSTGVVLLFIGLYQSAPAWRQGDASISGTLAFAFGMGFWALFAIHSTGYLQLIGSGVVQEVSTPSFMIIGVIGAAACLLLLVQGSMQVVRSNSP